MYVNEAFKIINNKKLTAEEKIKELYKIIEYAEIELNECYNNLLYI